MVRNAQRGPTVFSDATQHVEWAGSGDPHGADVQPVPPEFTDNVQFRRALTRGILVVEEAPDDIQAVLDAHHQEWQQRMQRQQEASARSIDATPERDMPVATCLAPDSKTDNGQCGKHVLASKNNDHPPLCDDHQHLSTQFVSEETGRIVGGKPEVAWIRTQMGARTRERN